MKKIFTCSFVLVIALGAFTSCAKDVKKPSKVSNNVATTTPSTNTNNTGSQPNSQNPNPGNTCGGGGGNYTDNNGGF